MLRDLGRVDEADAVLVDALAFAEANEGPSLRARRHLEAARLAVIRADSTKALAAVDTAERVLLEEQPRLQSRYVWRELLEVRASVEADLGDFDAARATLTHAHERMMSAGLDREALRVLHRLAEPFANEPRGLAVLADRERAAASSLRISAAAGLIHEEARALANVAVIHAERGRAIPARKMLDEAIWLAEGSIGLRAHFERCAAILAERLGQPT